MSANVADVTINSITERLVELSAGQIFVPLNTNTWDRLRIAARISMWNDPGAAPSTGRFFFGLSNGNAAGMGDATPGHCFGWGNFDNTGAWMAMSSRTTSGTRVIYATSAFAYPCKFVSGTPTVASSYLHFVRLNGNLAAPTTWNQSIVTVEFTRGSPDWGISGSWNSSWCENGTSYDARIVTQANVRASVNSNTDSFSNWADWYNEPQRTCAVDEGTDGVLNHLHLYWNLSSPYMRILDLMAFEIAP